MSPTTVPSSLQTPATFQTEPFGLAPPVTSARFGRVAKTIWSRSRAGEAAPRRRGSALTVGDRHLEDLAAPEPTRERALGLLDSHVRPLAPKLEAFVPEEGPGEQAGLAKDLEAVAASQDQPAAGHEARQGPDDRGAARHGPRPQVVAGEAAWENQAIEAADISVPVPHVLDRLVEHLGDDVVEIHVTPRAREDHDAESHEASSPDAVTVMPPFDRSRILLRDVDGYKTTH